MCDSTSNVAEPSSHATGHWWLALACSLTFLTSFMVICYHGGEDSCLRIHDCLDGGVPLISLSMRSDRVDENGRSVVEQLFNGVPSRCLPSKLLIGHLAYRYLNIAHAFILNELVMRIVALLGMALLLGRHVLPNRSPYMTFGLSLCFALLPFWQPIHLSIAGQPLLLFAILNLRAGATSIFDWLILAVFPFYSSFILAGWMLISLLGCYVIYRTVNRRKRTAPLWIALALVSLGYLAANYQQIVRAGGEHSLEPHRIESRWKPGVSLYSSAWIGKENLVYGNNLHAPSKQLPFVWIAIILLVTACVVQDAYQLPLPLRQRLVRLFSRGWIGSKLGVLVLLVGGCGMLSLVYGLSHWAPVVRSIDGLGSLWLTAANLGRVHFLHPLLWTIILALTLDRICEIFWCGKSLTVILISLQLSLVLHDNFINWDGHPIPDITCREFYSEELFSDIRRHIDRPPSDYRVASLGMFPAIPMHNGFYTLDGYSPTYSAEYKRAFRKVIAGELAKDEGIRDYFDNWGNRCYLFSAELGKDDILFTRHHATRRIENLDIDIQRLSEMGGSYIFSAVEIGNYQDLGLKLESVFERDDSPWQIFLYSLPEPSKTSV